MFQVEKFVFLLVRCAGMANIIDQLIFVIIASLSSANGLTAVKTLPARTTVNATRTCTRTSVSTFVKGVNVPFLKRMVWTTTVSRSDGHTQACYWLYLLSAFWCRNGVPGQTANIIQRQQWKPVRPSASQVWIKRHMAAIWFCLRCHMLVSAVQSVYALFSRAELAFVDAVVFI